MVLVAFNAIIPLMTVVNFSVQRLSRQRILQAQGAWFEQVLHSERFSGASRQMVFTGIILAIRSLASPSRLSMPARAVGPVWLSSGPTALIPRMSWVPWNILALPDIGLSAGP